MKEFFVTILIFALALSFANGYDVTCNFDSNVPPSCPTFSSISPITSANEIANFVGQPSNYIDNVTLHLFFDQNFVINFVPTDLFSHFINLQTFTAIHASVTSVTPNAFINCAKWNLLHFNFNNFNHLPGFFAEQCTNIKYLQVASNNIETIDENAFKGLISLEMVSLQGNLLQCLPPLLFQDNKNIQSLDLNSNKIKAMLPTFFKNLIQIQTIYLSYNQITYIPDLEFDFSAWNQASFIKLEMFDNPVAAISPLLLSHLYSNNLNYSIEIDYHTGFTKTCVNPNFSYNMDMFIINQLQWSQQNTIFDKDTTCYSNFTPQMADNSLATCGTPPTTPSTTSISTDLITTGSSTLSSTNAPNTPGSCSSDKICRYYLDYLNRYTCVLDGVDGLVSSISGTHYLTFTDANVERVYFANSNLNRIPNVLFIKFPNLNFLYVRNVGLGVINSQTFNQCGNLKYLDASYNDIIHIDETSLKNCTKLETIDLTGNPLDYVSTQLYVYDPSLKTIHLHRNPDFTLN